MGLREMLAGTQQFGYRPELGQGQAAQVHLNSVRSELLGLLPPLGLRVLVSGRAFNLPEVPWIAVLDPDVTKTAKSGLYVVYLYDAKLDHVFLTMNQGATAHRDHASKNKQPGITVPQAALAELHAESNAIRAELPSSLVAAFPRDVDLGSEGFLPKAYEAGSIAAIRYDLGSLPNEDKLRADLKTFLQIYDASVEARKSLTAINPGLFHTPVVATAAPNPEADVFRPKDSTDYVAQVAAHTQVRTRRHEAVVKAFGEHAKSRDWVPATNVHPRDLVLKKDGTHLLCEVKVVKANAEGAVREAIGQLFAYRFFLYQGGSSPDHLIAVFSDAVGSAFVDLLSSLGIESVWPCDGAVSWHGSPGAQLLGIAAPTP